LVKIFIKHNLSQFNSAKMGTSIQMPQSNIGRLLAMTRAQTRIDNLPPAGNILSAATTTRLLNDLALYLAGDKAIIAAKQAQSVGVTNANTERAILGDNSKAYFKNLNSAIDLGKILRADRAFYKLVVGNDQSPSMNTTEKLMTVAANIISGDALMQAAGGIALSTPTIAQYAAILASATPIINALDNFKTILTTAKGNLNLQNKEVDDLIKHIWDEVQAYYSLLSPSAMRAIGRLWGLRWISTGVPSVVTGTCVDELGVAVAGAKIRLVGSSRSVLTDAMGNFSLNTSLYGDLELLATLKKYEKFSVEFSKDDGVAIAVAVVMVHSV
jgi:hypothetical protein